MLKAPKKNTISIGVGLQMRIEDMFKRNKRWGMVEPGIFFQWGFTFYAMFHLCFVTTWCLFQERDLTNRKRKKKRQKAGNVEQWRISSSSVPKLVFRAETIMAGTKGERGVR